MFFSPENHSQEVYDQALSELADTNESSDKQHIFETAKQLLGRAALLLGLTAQTLATTYVTEDVLLQETSIGAAVTNDYPDSNAKDCSAVYGIYSWCKGTPPADISPRGYGYRNCTDWAAYRIPQLTGVSVPKSLGHANTWDTKAPSNWVIDAIPEPGDIAQSDAGDMGHVGVVEEISVNTQGKAVSLKISEFNGAGDGIYSIKTYHADSNGVFWRDQGKTKKWDTFIDTNGTGKGILGSPNTVPFSNLGRLLLINSNGTGHGKDNLEPGGWHTITGPGDAASVSASDTHIALINASGQAWSADVSSAALQSNSPGLQRMNIPLSPNTAGGVQKIAIDKDGNMIAINNCGAAYGWRNTPEGQRWVAMTNCGDAKDIEIGGGRLALINGCGGAYISDSGYSWNQILQCGDAKAISVGESGKVIAINGSNTAYVLNPGSTTWMQKSAIGDAKKVAIGTNRIMIITNGGAAWAADIGQNSAAPLVQLTNNGDAKAITVGSHDRMGLINSAGAAYASDTIVQGGNWTPETSDGDARTFVVA